MVKVGLGLPGKSINDIRSSAEVAASFEFDSFSVYGDLGDLPPYAVLGASADVFTGSSVGHIGPMGVPVGLQHPEIIAGNALALDEQLPGKTYVGLVRGAFLESIGERPASLDRLKETIKHIRMRFAESEKDIPVCIGGFGSKVLHLAGELEVEGLKLGGSTNYKLAEMARNKIENQDVKIVLGAVSVIDNDRIAARTRARAEVAKYLNVVGPLDTTLEGEDIESLDAFISRFRQGDPSADRAISDSLLDKFSLAGTPEDACELLIKMDGNVDRFEFGTPHGLGDRASAIKHIGQTILEVLKDHS